MDVITSHLNADFDALASAIAAKKLYPDAVIVFPGSLEKKVRDFVDAFQPVEIKKLKDIPLEKVTRLIVVDAKHPDRIGPLRALLSNKEVKVHIYDHHPAGREDMRGEVEVFEDVGAASTIFAEIIEKKKTPLSPIEATLLCLGIYEETGSLTFKSTTPRDLMAASFLLKKGANLNIVSTFLKMELSAEELALLNQLIQSLREVVVHGIRVRIAKGKIEGFGDVAHLAHTIMDMEDMDALVLLIELEGKVLIVARSKASELDVAQLLSPFGGGGHSTAASATVKGEPLELIEEKILAAVRAQVRPTKIAKDIMTTPVVTVQWNNRIREAEGMMTRYGVNVLPVLKRDAHVGILSREIVEKALFHGLGDNRAIDFATTDALTVNPATPIADIERAMIERNQRFVSVLDSEGHIAGAITRTDILRSIYEDFLRRSRVSSKELSSPEPVDYGKHITGLLREKFPAHLVAFLTKAGEIADEMGYGAYLVGGSVRDLLRGEENLDIDIVIEGNGIDFAKRLGEKIGAKVTVHQRFGTAVVQKERFKLDIATARTEYYESPAALPKVETSSIKKDLYRRDFTVNTLAVKLNKRDFGHLIDFFGGQRDLKDRVIRVLHNLSFVEDPTRAFRAVRFAERFDFRISKHTEHLIKLALRMNVFEKLSGSRLYDELILIFNEADPVKVIKRLHEFGLLKVIHPKLHLTRDLDALLRSVQATVAWFELSFLDEEYDKGMLYFMALLSRLDKAEREEALKRLAVPLHYKDALLKGMQAAQEIIKELKPESPIKVYTLLTDKRIEAILFSMALTQDTEKKKAVSHFLLEWRNVKPLLKGEDLKKLGIPPGPLYSELFRMIVHEKLMNGLATKDEELAFVQKQLHKRHR